ncbi:MAG: hypothetical protein Ta2A_23660 [Treponemataceae bacterium]|nr:MAG: hypothetical protein Ta2A_23660 [Treponemataceae bacterium]
MEVAKFALTAVGTFVSVISISFAVFQYWKKQQEAKFDELEGITHNAVSAERTSRKEDIKRLEERIAKLEETITQSLIDRISSMEGELKGFRNTLNKIQDWFICNTSR